MKQSNILKLMMTMFIGLIAVSNEPLINIKFFRPIYEPVKSFFLARQFKYSRIPLLRNVPKSDQLGIVKKTFLLEVKDAQAPYNPAVIKSDGKFEIVYREDVKTQNKSYSGPYYTFLKRAVFDKNFMQVSPSETVSIESVTAEDPRMVANQDQKILVFNDTRKNSKTRIMNYINLAKETKSQALELSLSNVEKNWSPFFSENKLHFIYQVLPHKVLSVDSHENPKLHFVDGDYDTRDFSFWIWGIPRGGTPAVEHNGEYLSFFHSSFKHKDMYVYVMGAYTFEKKAPFRITSFSRFPIVFDEIYSAPLLNTADHNKRVLFPSGLVVDEENNEIHVFCGENDSAIRVISIDPNLLSLNMQKIKEKPEKRAP